MRHMLTSTAHLGTGLAIAILALAATPATAQKLGKGGIGIDETSEVPRCDVPLGTIALVEDRTAAPSEDDIPAGLRAMIRMAEAQNGGAGQKIDPLPLLKLLTSQSNCFQVLDRGEGFDALQRERALAAGGTVANGNTQATLLAADYLLTARVLYSDGNAGGSGGGLGTMFPGAIGFKSKKLESQTMLTLVEVKTGLQKAVSTGSARKKDISIIGGALTGSGIGALGCTGTHRPSGPGISRPRSSCTSSAAGSGSCGPHRHDAGDRSIGAVGGKRDGREGMAGE